MTEENFRFWVTIAAFAVVFIFLINVVAWAVLAYVALSIKSMVAGVIAKVDPLLPRVTATLGEVQQTVARVTETTNQLATEVRSVSAAVTTSAERVSVIATESAEEIRSLVLATSSDIKAMVGSTSHEVTDLVIQSSTQMKGVMRASTDTAHGSLDRLDVAVDRTVARFEETSAYVQEGVLTPIREVAAVVTGIKVALETLLGYPERKQIDQAYQDEELFI